MSEGLRSGRNVLWIHSVKSGLYAAICGVVGKVVYDNDIVVRLCESFSPSESLCDAKSVQIGIHGLLFGVLAFIHILMFEAFNKALKLSSTSLEVTVINSATNFLFTGVLGCVLFSESLGLGWVLGTSLILLGSFVLILDEQDKVKDA
eukprot:TRINITY_DN5122_c0_g1_i1.p1 TRINITY_DN5122_c0_g1~~TRINITY_DN5122_c0_g1_i1.p1  ORF type:complete len:148 (+),score=15.74 TRINITY_DN5122_c0_g1_i1:180-623(+)